MKSNVIRIITHIVLGILFLSACTLPSIVSPTPTSIVPDIVPPLPSATNTLPPPTDTPPAPDTEALTPEPTEQSTEMPLLAIATINTGQAETKIRFPEGRTGVQLAGRLDAGEKHAYVLRAIQDQSMLLDIYTPAQNGTLAVYGVMDGETLLSPSENIRVWQGRLPADQEYRVEVIGANQPAEYLLTIQIPRVVRFFRGTYGSVEEGIASPGEIITYRLRAFGGQTMNLWVTSSGDTAFLGVYGLDDGEPLLRPESELIVWEGILPSDQNYIVQVYNAGTQEVSFDLEVVIR